MVFISGGVLANNLFPDRRDLSSSAITVYFGGAGAGMVFSGAGIPWPLSQPQATMRGASAWLVIAGVSTLLRGLRHLGGAPDRGAVERRSKQSVANEHAFHAAFGSYFLFGVGYIAYMTFVVAWMVSHGASALDVALTSGSLGLATMLAPLAWRVPRSRWPAAKTLAAAGVVISVGAAIPLLQHVASCHDSFCVLLRRCDVHGSRRCHRSRQDVAPRTPGAPRSPSLPCCSQLASRSGRS